MPEITRRQFLEIAGGAGAAAAAAGSLPGCDWIPRGLPDTWHPAQPEVALLRSFEPGEEVRIPSVCLQCPGSCGIEVRVVEGRAVKIEGNPASPMNEGRLCLKGQAGLQVLYDPDRVPGPMRQVVRDGKRTGEWEAIGWDEAIGLVASRLGEMRARRAPEQLVFVGGRVAGTTGDLIARFMRAFGSPNLLLCGDDGYAGVQMAHYLAHGARGFLSYDLANADMVLCFGGALLEAMRGTLLNIGNFVQMRVGRRGRRGRLVQIDPRFSVTAAKADTWVPIAPGTDAALALGLAHVIVREGLHDEAFLREHVHGFRFPDGDGRRGYADLVLDEAYSPRSVSRVTGVSAEQIEDLAREFARRRPALALCGRGVSALTGGTYAAFAIHALNALVGSVNRPGGVIVQQAPRLRSLLDTPPLSLDEIAREGLARPRRDRAGSAEFPLARSVLHELAEDGGSEDGGAASPIGALFLYYANPCFSQPDCTRFDALLERTPLVVSFSPFWDDSTLRADIVLPDHTYLERYQDDIASPGPGFAVYGFRQPVVAPVCDTRSSGDLLLALARRLGGSVAEAMPWETALDAIKAAAAGLGPGPFEALGLAERGGHWEHARQEDELRRRSRERARLESERGAARDAGSRAVVEAAMARTDRAIADLTRQVAEARSHVFASDWGLVFPNRTGKFELYSETLRRDLEEAAVRLGLPVDDLLARMRIQARGDLAFLPHFEPPRTMGDPERFPLVLNSYKTMSHAEGRGGNAPWLQTTFNALVPKPRWEMWVEINPETARSNGIEHGDMVLITSEKGSISARARLFAGARPDVVNVPFEFGHRAPEGSAYPAYGRWASGRGENPNTILAACHDHLSGGPCFHATRVRIEKATAGAAAAATAEGA